MSEETAGQSVKVTLDGYHLWWLVNEQGGGALASPEQTDETGDIVSLAVALTGTSYAHIYGDGRIQRYGKVIGHRDTLQRGWV